MYLYYGASIEEAKKILFERLVRGVKGNRKHHNRYVALSDDKNVARQFGEVVFRFELEEDSGLISADNQDNNEIPTFLEKGRRGQKSGEFVKENYLLKNKLDFWGEPVTIYLVESNDNKLENFKNEINDFLVSGDKLTKNPHMYKNYRDFTENKSKN